MYNENKNKLKNVKTYWDNKIASNANNHSDTQLALSNYLNAKTQFENLNTPDSKLNKDGKIFLFMFQDIQGIGSNAGTSSKAYAPKSRAACYLLAGIATIASSPKSVDTIIHEIGHGLSLVHTFEPQLKPHTHEVENNNTDKEEYENKEYELNTIIKSLIYEAKKKLSENKQLRKDLKKNPDFTVNEIIKLKRLKSAYIGIYRLTSGAFSLDLSKTEQLNNALSVAIGIEALSVLDGTSMTEEDLDREIWSNPL